MSQPSDDQREDRLAAGDGTGGLDRAVRQDLDRIRVEGLLAQQDASAELTRAIEEAVRAPLEVAEIAGVLDRLEKPAFAELENLLASPEADGLKMEKNLLTELLREGAEGQSILKRGLVFLKHRRYAEAVEWWTLHRRNLDAASSRLHLLLLIMEVLAYQYAGDHQRAEAVRHQVLAHKVYRGRPADPEKGLTRPGE